MGWIVDIVAREGSLRVVEQTDDGDLVVALSDVPSRIERDKGNLQRGKFIELALSDFERTSDATVLDRFAVPDDVRRCQAIFQYRRARTTYYIPAQVLIAGLFCPNQLTRSCLLTASGYEMLAMLTELPSGAVEVEASRLFPRRKGDLSAPLLGTLLWTACYPSAKRMVASVFNNALAGRLDLALAAGHASLSLAGSRIGNEVLVEALQVEWVQPDEQPYAGLEGRTPARIVFRERGAERPDRRLLRSPSSDEGLSLGSAGWVLTDYEWMVIESILASTMSPRGLAGKGLGQNPRRKVEQLLRKLSEGIPWRKVGHTRAEGSNASAFFAALRRDGRWDRIKAFLEHFRATKSARQPHAPGVLEQAGVA